MVIFHSYVKLPEGSHFHGQISGIVGICFRWFFLLSFLGSKKNCEPLLRTVHCHAIFWGWDCHQFILERKNNSFPEVCVACERDPTQVSWVVACKAANYVQPWDFSVLAIVELAMREGNHSGTEQGTSYAFQNYLVIWGLPTVVSVNLHQNGAFILDSRIELPSGNLLHSYWKCPTCSWFTHKR